MNPVPREKLQEVANQLRAKINSESLPEDVYQLLAAVISKLETSEHDGLEV